MDKSQAVSQVTFVAFDFETTGLYAGQDSIVEFGAAKFRNGQVLETFGALVDPGRPMPPDATRVSGITDAMLKGQPAIATVLPDFMRFIGDSVLVAHNAPFDWGFLRTTCDRNGLAMPPNQFIDTQVLAKKAYPGQKSYSLQNLAAFLRFPPNQAHRAVDDSVMCMKLFLACANELAFMGDITLGEVMD
jgi:DNA polymerase III epsilon subunit family exonuclease